MKKKRKFKLYQKIFLASLAFFLSTRTFVSSYNVSLNVKYQDNKRTIVELTNQIETLKRDVQKLSSYDRISTVASKEGMTPNFNGVVLVNSE